MTFGVSRHLTPVRSSRDTLSAVPPGGNPQDRTASPHGWLLYLGKPHRPWRLPLGEDRSGSPSHIGRG
ncbi:hypothetical protein [Nostoc sp.]|uniref:hypothetical protein n=1 Tax=Nostoc sp. TaxID=1180 RepID=UPI002FF53069